MGLSQVLWPDALRTGYGNPDFNIHSHSANANPDPATTNSYSLAYTDYQPYLYSNNVTVNGQVLGPLGELGQVVEKEWTMPGVPTRTPAPTATP